MKATHKRSALQEAYERVREAREHLRGLDARCMETTEDKCGILWERWLLPNFRNVYLYATPHGWDLSVTASLSQKTQDTFVAITQWSTG